ncbi:MAG: hypothetical protein IIV74_00815, partial [Alphaproteobacteria bacterium]|nr:hypothetical protein [Alphaproteobacteria bacterium]
IKATQDTMLSDYAEQCTRDITSCLTTNGYDPDKSGTTKNKIATKACNSQIVTCMSVNGITENDDSTVPEITRDEWVSSLMGAER